MGTILLIVGSVLAPSANLMCGVVAIFTAFWRHVYTSIAQDDPASVGRDGTPWYSEYGAQT